jgi:hypothetical protein
MANVVESILHVRGAVCAVMRIRKHKKHSGKKKPSTVEYQLAFVGTAWCINPNRFLVTAQHILNGGKLRDPDDLFYVFSVPENGPSAFELPVVAFPVENTSADLAILEVGAPAHAGQTVPAIPVTFGRPHDGSSVTTYGFPAPAIHGAQVSPDGHFIGGGQFFLKGHANEGIVAAQYDVGGSWQYEFNVGWHHGESGGPVCQLEPLAAFAVMQSYRNVKTPHGVMAGPHCGRALSPIKEQLRECGASVV